MKKMILMVSVLLAVATNSYPSGWEQVSKDDISIEYYNPGRIEAAGQTRIFYTKTVWAASGVLFAKGEYFISKIEVDCSKKKIRLLERQYFDENGVPGTKENIHNLAILKPSEFKEKKIKEDTLFWFNLVCRNDKKP